MNKCIFLGRFTKDAEIKYTANNLAIANFSLAVNKKFKKEGQPTADFINFVAMDKTAENIGKFFSKGDLILVTTRCQVRSWDDKDGKKHYTTEFFVEEFDFVGGNNSSNGGKKETSSDDNEFVL